ncbi:MAG: hypothetical protein RMY36_001230 [Nostoc sp. SerVER01]|nr:hypothetical protein [Nostoc sp. SerVER01]
MVNYSCHEAAIAYARHERSSYRHQQSGYKSEAATVVTSWSSGFFNST